MAPAGDERTKSTALGTGDDEPRRRLLAFWKGGYREFSLPRKGSLDVGRSRLCQLHVDHASVSRTHVVWHAGDVDAIEDCGSSNGTRLNGRRIAPHARVTVHPGDSIEIGKVILLLQGGSPADGERPGGGGMARVHKLVELAAPTDLTVLLLGETGVGKDVLAERIHHVSPRAARPLLRINCAALPGALLESELFGHERGAFTGAVQAKPGLLEAAEGGTILLDEIGEMPVATQAKLLVALERRELLRVGSIRPRSFDVRFVAATNQELDKRVASGDFRSDLFYRLNGVTIRIPALRERLDEIKELAQGFVRGACTSLRRPPLSIDRGALALLRTQRYPGNVRELRSVVERAVAFATGGVIDASVVELSLAANAGPAAAASPVHEDGLRPEVEALMRQRILEALERCGGNQTKAASLLGMPRRTLVSRLSRYGMIKPR